MKNVLWIIFVLILGACTQERQIKQLTYKDLKEINSVNDLSVNEYLNLVSSVDVARQIFSNKDTSISIFASLIKMGVEKPILSIPSNLSNGKWIDKSDINYLFRLSDSREKAIPSVKAIASYSPDSLSTIGAQALFLISIYKGDKYMYSNGELVKYQSEISKHYKSWWNKYSQDF